MKRYLAPIAIALLCATVAFAGPFRLRFFQRCGPNGCEILPQAEQQPIDQKPIDQKKDEPLPSKDPVTKNFGIDCSKLTPGRCILNGREVTMQHALNVLTGQIPDDSKKLRLTVIGSDAERKPVMDAVRQLEPEFKDRLAPWGVRPDHWSLKDGVTGQTLFKADGRPTIYLQAPDGKVIHRQDDWQGPEDMQAIRKAVKAYDASKDKDLRKPDDKKKPANPDAQPTTISPLILVAIAAIAFLLFRRKQ